MNKEYSIKTAAERWSFSQAYFRKLVFEKTIPYHKLGRNVRMYEKDLIAHFKKIARNV